MAAPEVTAAKEPVLVVGTRASVLVGFTPPVEIQLYVNALPAAKPVPETLNPLVAVLAGMYLVNPTAAVRVLPEIVPMVIVMLGVMPNVAEATFVTLVEAPS